MLDQPSTSGGFYSEAEGPVDDWMRRKIEQALNDPRPSIPAEDVFAGLRAHHAALVKARGQQD